MKHRPLRSMTAALAVALLAPAGGALAREAPHLAVRAASATLTRSGITWPTVIAPWAIQAAMRNAATHPRPSIRKPFRKDAAATMWLSDNGGYIWELTSTAAVVGALTDCKGPQGIKVDHFSNLWVVCAGTQTIQEYAPGATAATLVLDDTPGFVPADVAVDSNGDVYASNIDGFACSSSSCNVYDGNVVYWLQPYLASGATPTGTITDPNIYEGYFLDTDESGNVYIDMLNLAANQGETDEILAPLSSSSSIVNLNIDPGYPGGVYVSNGGTVLNVLDQNNSTIARYDLSTGSFLKKFGKLPQNWEKTCNPIDMGFSQGDVDVGVGDSSCNAFDHGIVKSSHFKQLLNSSFITPIGAAFTVSDK